jgi:predicted flavoprotein YhiN
MKRIIAAKLKKKLTMSGKNKINFAHERVKVTTCF